MNASPSDYYALLGVARDADQEAIRAAYRMLAKQHHPDLAGEAEEASAEKFLEIQEAYDVLRDPVRRAQYDFERTRIDEVEEERRKQRDLVRRQAQGLATPAAQPAPAFAAPRHLPPHSTKFYIGALLFVGVALGLIALQHHLRQVEAQEHQITVVRVDEARQPNPLDGLRSGEKPPARVPPSLAELSQEMERLSRQQAARAEAARNKTGAPAGGEKVERKAAAAEKPAAAAAADGRIVCSGEGRSFFVLRQDDAFSVSYNGGPEMRPVMTETDTGMVVMSKVEPTNRISLGFMKGDKDRTVVLIFDAVGNLFRTFGVDCSAAVF